MNKTLLRQALKFYTSSPTNYQVKLLSSLATQYQQDNEIQFLNIKYRQKPEITDEKSFFEFLSESNNLNINSFEDIEFLLDETTTRKESIEKYGDSKEYYTKVFERVVMFQRGEEVPGVYKDIDKLPFIRKKPILAVENGETFLNIYKIMSQYGFEQFVYLSGFPNSLTKEFLKDKDVVFFLDYDIEAIRIYDSIKCKSKKFFKHPDLEDCFENETYCNEALYKKQRVHLPKHHDELQWLIDLIEKYSAVVEQEIFN